LPGYVNGEAIDGEDVVVRYLMSFQHEPRTEDWLEMPVVWNSFKLMPRDFLDSTPLSEFDCP
jgi:Cu2+-containing amine oxidase